MKEEPPRNRETHKHINTRTRAYIIYKNNVHLKNPPHYWAAGEAWVASDGLVAESWAALSCNSSWAIPSP
jgi:hypothetical protein